MSLLSYIVRLWRRVAANASALRRARRMRRAGVTNRLTEVADVLSTHQWKHALRAEASRRLRVNPLKSAQDVADCALELLRTRFNVDTTDVALQVDWRPSKRRRGTLKLTPVPDFRTVQRLG